MALPYPQNALIMLEQLEPMTTVYTACANQMNGITFTRFSSVYMVWSIYIVEMNNKDVTGCF